MKKINPYLPPTLPERLRSDKPYSEVARDETIYLPPEPRDETMITLRLPRRRWAEELIRIAYFRNLIDKLAEQLESEGDHLYMTDVYELAKRFLDPSSPELLLMTEVQIAPMSMETVLSVVHSVQCDEEHSDGKCEWQRRLESGYFALL
jgi:hypothetical protein